MRRRLPHGREGEGLRLHGLPEAVKEAIIMISGTHAKQSRSMTPV